MAERSAHRYEMLDGDFRAARARLAAGLACIHEGGPSHVSSDETGAIAELREWASDELLLRALQRGTTERDDDVGVARDSFEPFQTATPELKLTWDDLVDSGWTRTVWGRVYVHGFRSGRFHGDGPGPLEAVGHVKPSTEREEIEIPNFDELLQEHRRRHPNAGGVEEFVSRGFVERRGENAFVSFRTRLLQSSGPWLFARLWDDRSAGPSDPSRRLTWWMDLNSALHLPAGSFADFLDLRHRDEFERTAWERLHAEPDLVGWEEERRRIAAQVCLQNGRDDLDEMLEGIPTLRGDTWVDRLQWLDLTDNFEGPFDVQEAARRRLVSLFRYVLRWRRELNHPDAASEWGTRIESLVRSPRVARCSEKRSGGERVAPR